MKIFGKRPRKPAAGPEPTRPEALAAVVHRSPAIAWTILDNGDILIEYPLNLRPFFIQLLHRWQKRPARRLTKKLQLDAMGSRVWLLFDGEKQVKTIIRELAETSGLSLQEAEQSVTTFLRQLGRRGLIVLR